MHWGVSLLLLVCIMMHCQAQQQQQPSPYDLIRGYWRLSNSKPDPSVCQQALEMNTRVFFAYAYGKCNISVGVTNYNIQGFFALSEDFILMRPSTPLAGTSNFFGFGTQAVFLLPYTVNETHFIVRTNSGLTQRVYWRQEERQSGWSGVYDAQEPASQNPELGLLRVQADLILYFTPGKMQDARWQLQQGGYYEDALYDGTGYARALPLMSIIRDQQHAATALDGSWAGFDNSGNRISFELERNIMRFVYKVGNVVATDSGIFTPLTSTNDTTVRVILMFFGVFNFQASVNSTHLVFFEPSLPSIRSLYPMTLLRITEAPALQTFFVPQEVADQLSGETLDFVIGSPDPNTGCVLVYLSDSVYTGQSASSLISSLPQGMMVDPCSSSTSSGGTTSLSVPAIAGIGVAASVLLLTLVLVVPLTVRRHRLRADAERKMNRLEKNPNNNFSMQQNT